MLRLPALEAEDERMLQENMERNHPRLWQDYQEWEEDHVEILRRWETWNREEENGDGSV